MEELLEFTRHPALIGVHINHTGRSKRSAPHGMECAAHRGTMRKYNLLGKIRCIIDCSEDIILLFHYTFGAISLKLNLNNINSHDMVWCLGVLKGCHAVRRRTCSSSQIGQRNCRIASITADGAFALWANRSIWGTEACPMLTCSFWTIAAYRLRSRGQVSGGSAEASPSGSDSLSESASSSVPRNTSSSGHWTGSRVHRCFTTFLQNLSG